MNPTIIETPTCRTASSHDGPRRFRRHLQLIELLECVFFCLSREVKDHRLLHSQEFLFVPSLISVLRVTH